MNKELVALLKKGKVETDEDFQLFCKYSDEVITDTYADAEITDVRIYLLKEKGIFCEIYADVNKGEWEELANAIHKQQEEEEKQKQLIREKELSLKQTDVSNGEWEELKTKFPTWKKVFEKADGPTQRVLVNKLIERIDITNEQIVIRFKINLNDFFQQPRISDGFGVSQ